MGKNEESRPESKQVATATFFSVWVSPMAENKSKNKNEKIFEMKKRNGEIAKFRFVKDGGVWHWDMLHKQSKQDKKLGIVKSLPLPDVNLDKCNTLKDCFDAIAKYRGSDWVGQIYADIMAS